jgi:hypothetical protein
LVVFPLVGRNQFLRFKLCELDRCQRAEARIGTAMVIIIAPGFDGLAGLREAEEHVLVETLIAQLAVE